MKVIILKLVLIVNLVLSEIFECEIGDICKT